MHRGDGTPWGTLIVGHDVTDLARTVQVKDELVATVAHELRTPLISILGYAEVLQDNRSALSSGTAMALAAIQRNALRLREAVTQLVETAERRKILDLRPVDLSVLTRHVADRFTAAAGSTSMALVVEAHEPAWAEVDAPRMEQVIHHLLSNALQYTDPGGHIRLKSSGTADLVRVTVSDDGLGMSADEVGTAARVGDRSGHAA